MKIALGLALCAAIVPARASSLSCDALLPKDFVAAHFPGRASFHEAAAGQSTSVASCGFSVLNAGARTGLTVKVWTDPQGEVYRSSLSALKSQAGKNSAKGDAFAQTSDVGARSFEYSQVVAGTNLDYVYFTTKDGRTAAVTASAPTNAMASARLTAREVAANLASPSSPAASAAGSYSGSEALPYRCEALIPARDFEAAYGYKLGSTREQRGQAAGGYLQCVLTAQGTSETIALMIAAGDKPKASFQKRAKGADHIDTSLPQGGVYRVVMLGANGDVVTGSVVSAPANRLEALRALVVVAAARVK